MLPLGFDPVMTNSLEGKVIRILDTPDGRMIQSGLEEPKVLPISYELKKMDLLSLGLGVAGDMQAKRSHDKILADLCKWGPPRISSEIDGLHCDFGVLNYRFDASRDFWPVYHEFVTKNAEGVISVQSRCEIRLSNDHGIWLPVSAQIENRDKIENYEMRWVSVNLGVEDKYLSPEKFVIAAKTSLVQ
jgi:hypothetical protein